MVNFGGGSGILISTYALHFPTFLHVNFSSNSEHSIITLPNLYAVMLYKQKGKFSSFVKDKLQMHHKSISLFLF